MGDKKTQSIYVYKILITAGLVACLVLVLLIFGSYMVADGVIKTNQKNSALINVSGRQRMLSQSIADISSNLISYPEERQNLRHRLLEVCNLIEKSHQSLLYGDQAIGLFGDPSSEIKRMMFEPPHSVDKGVSDYIEAARSLINTSDNKLTIANPDIRYIHASSGVLLNNLNDITNQYQREGEAGLADLRDQQKIIMATQISVILLLTLLIFLPLVRRVHREILKAVMSEKHLSSVIDHMLDGLITIDAQCIVQSFNPAAERIFGYKSEEVVGGSVNILMPEPDYSEHNDYLKRHLDTGITNTTGISRKVVGKRKDGSTFPLDLSINEMHLSETHRFFCTVRDISVRQQHEQQLIAAKETAEQVSQAKDSFLATMSHEIRTPLAGMLGMLEVLSMSPLDHEQEPILKAAWDSARNLLRIVNDILDWSKIQDGKLILSPQSTSIPMLLQEVVNTYSHVASAKNLKLWQHADSQLSAAHIVDPLRLSQVLNNFVSNALKFTEQGEIELCAELLEQLESGERIRFFVKDTGVGIPKIVQPKLFERFQQESADTARQYGGTGLGLSICLHLAEFLDGKIELVSEPGLGAIFSITVILPISAAPGEALPTPVPVVEQKKIRPLFDNREDAPMILAVDDHPINRDLLARQITLLGLRVETAEDGLVALSKWRAGHFALVITDCHMPEMDGYSFARAVRKIEMEEILPRTPIIAWTANARIEEGQFCEDAGMDGLLVKLSGMTLLKTMLAKWLSIPAPEKNQFTAYAGGETKGPIDYAELSKVVPDSAEQIQVLYDFQQYISADRGKLIEMLVQGDPLSVQYTAHRIKGSCLMVGATEMASAYATIEQTAMEGNIDGARTRMTELHDAFERFDSYLATLTDSKGEADESE